MIARVRRWRSRRSARRRGVSRPRRGPTRCRGRAWLSRSLVSRLHAGIRRAPRYSAGLARVNTVRSSPCSAQRRRKSTLNRAISGVLRLIGRARSDFAGGAIEGALPSSIVSRGLIHVPEGRPAWPPDMTVAENLDLGCYRRGARAARVNRSRVLDLSAPCRAAAAKRRHAVGRRAADAGDRPRADGGAEAVDPGRAVARPSPLLVEELFALIGGQAEGSRVLLVEQNVVQSSRWRSAPMSWKTADSRCREARPTSAQDPP